MEFPGSPEGYELVAVREGNEKSFTSSGLMHMTYDVTYKKIAPEPRSATIFDVGHWVEHVSEGRVRLICVDMGWAWYKNFLGHRHTCLASELKTTVPLGWRNVQADDKDGVEVNAGKRDPSQCLVRGILVAQTGGRVCIFECKSHQVVWFDRDVTWVYGRVDQ